MSAHKFNAADSICAIHGYGVCICGLVVFEQIAEQTSGKSNSVGINFGSVESQVNQEIEQRTPNERIEFELNRIELN